MLWCNVTESSLSVFVSTMQYKEQAVVLWMWHVWDSQVNLQESARDYWHRGSYVLWICTYVYSCVV